ncbi:MAG: ribosome biogenesis GTPase Der [Flavobacteriales bacterium]
MSNILAIVGRPNVGKSTLFNRLTESRDAIVDPTEGVTRDRHYGKSFWNGHEFSVIDTGGYIVGSEDVFEEEIRKQVKLAIEEATVILFMVDVMAGVTDMDREVANLLRRSKKRVLLVANKIDTPDKAPFAAEFYSFGLGEIWNISAQNGSGTGELLDEVTKDFINKSDDEEEKTRMPRFAIVGKPNVGKSSLLNSLVGQDRNIVTSISGTTRDSILTRYNAFGFEFDLIDTAGIRKRAKVHEDIEFYSVLRSIRTIEESDVCLFMIDAKEGIQKQDLHIYYMIESNKKGVVVLVNKWDLVEKDTKTLKAYEDNLRQALAPFNDVPILFISALTKQRIHKALEEAMRVYQIRSSKIPTSQLNEILLPILEQSPPPSYKSKYIRIKYVTQLPTAVPSFAFFCNLPQYIKDSYKRFIENQLRKHFDFNGVPIRIFFRKK